MRRACRATRRGDRRQSDAHRDLHHADQERPLHQSVRRARYLARVLAARRCSTFAPAMTSTFGEYKPFVMVGANHIGSQRNEPASFPTGYDSADSAAPRFRTPRCAGTGCRATRPTMRAIGVSKDNWTVQVHGQQHHRTRMPARYTSSGQFIESQVPLRPRVLMLMFSMKFGGEPPPPAPPPAAPPPPVAADRRRRRRHLRRRRRPPRRRRLRNSCSRA